ncbi:MAG: T9SS type A sorting domain-containing protein [Saprospiraceae bacterium]|nr:T9SS type A sorting domain-containing protein [Saprospiraceae bacterium]
MGRARPSPPQPSANVPTGILTFGVNVYSRSNGMRSVTSGVRSLNLNNKDAFIFDNEIAAKDNGILVSGLRPLTRSNIDNNFITMDYNTAGRGINSINSSKGGASWLRMNGNIVDVMDATFGMDMLNNNGVEASGNYVTLINPQEGYGISVNGGGSNDLLGNFLNAVGSSNLQYGIAVGQSSGGEYGCNIFDGTRTGLWFTGPNDFSDIKGNDFNNFFHGLQIGNLAAPGPNTQNQGGFTGRQSHRGNTWSTDPSATGWGAIHYSEDPGEVSESQHEVDVNDGASYITTQRTYAEIIPGQPMPFFDPESGDTYTCPSNLQGSGDNTALGTIAYAIASGTTTVGTSAGENWTAKRQLYRHLKANPSLAPQGSVYATYLSNEAISTVGKFEDLQAAVDAMLVGDANARQQLGNYATSMEAKFGEMKTIMDGLSTQPNDPNLLAQRDAKRTEIANVSAQLQSVEQSMQSARVSAANQLLANNAAIVANATYEANQKTANRVRLEVVANGQVELMQQQVADLTPIAVQCPYTGGEGVYLARAILGNEVVYNDFAACGMSTGGGQQIKSPNEGEPTLPMFTIYPNPASDYIAIQLLNKLEGDASFVLTNVLGVQLRKETLSKGSDSAIMFTDGLTAGTYCLTLRSGAGVRSQVLLIAK